MRGAIIGISRIIKVNAVLDNVFWFLFILSLFCFGIGFALCPDWYRSDTESTEHLS
jgi:hypothetical protein